MSLRTQWKSDQPTLGAWLSIPSTLTAEIVARQQFNYVCIDTQHGLIDYADAARMIPVIELAGGTPIARAAWNESGGIGKLLDAGVHAVIVPMVNTADQAAAVVRACHYAPLGSRSWGPIAAGMRHTDNKAWADTNIAAIPMIETAEALDNLDAILATPGIDAIYVGPADLSVSLGLPPGNNDGETAFDEALATILAACRRHGVTPGIHATGTLTSRRLDQGFKMITVTSDATAMGIGLRTELATVNSAQPGSPSGPMY